MRLLVKITLFYLAVSFLVLLIGGIITFYLIKREIDKEHQFYLRDQMKVVTKSIQNGVPLENIKNSKVQIAPLGSMGEEAEISFSDTLVWHPFLERDETNLKLQVTRKINGEYYAISIHDVIVEVDDIMDAASGSVILIFLLLLVVIVTFSIFISSWIFRPFNETLEKIKTFKLASKEHLNLKPTKTKEFAKLNEFLQQMTTKSQKDYFNLKKFNENASHEMQTPLAIAKGKIELLMESPNLSENEIKLVNSAHESILKLSKLGKSLSLLSKIENQEFVNYKKIDFTELAEKTITGFEELIELKSIKININLESNVQVRMDPLLADIMLTNLIQNSVRHNHQGGEIEVLLTCQSLEISNTGNPPEKPPSEFFDRFSKSQKNSDSIGLGLSIVKEICDLSDMKIQYDYKNQYHLIKVGFNVQLKPKPQT